MSGNIQCREVHPGSRQKAARVYPNEPVQRFIPNTLLTVFTTLVPDRSVSMAADRLTRPLPKRRGTGAVAPTARRTPLGWIGRLRSTSQERGGVKSSPCSCLRFSYCY